MCAAYPINSEGIEGECEEVNQREIEQAGVTEPLISVPLAEQLLTPEASAEGNSESVDIGLTSATAAADTQEGEAQLPDEGKQVTDTNIVGETGNNRIEVSPDIEMCYPLRNRGAKVEHNEWVMRTPREYSTD